MDLSRKDLGTNTTAHEFGHLLGLADLYAVEYDRSRVTGRDGRLDESLDRNMGQSWPTLLGGKGNLMGDMSSTSLSQTQLREIAKPAVENKSAGGSGNALLVADERLPKAESAARLRDYNSTTYGPPTAEMARFLNGGSRVRRGQAEYDHDFNTLRKQREARSAGASP